MAADTFGATVRLVRLFCPLAPFMLARQWVTSAYQEVCDRKAWSWLRAENEFLINASKTGTVNVTHNSDTVSGGSIAYAASDVNRQFRTGTASPIYTIIDADNTHYQLDRVWGPASATATAATVLDAYLTMPADFRRFEAVLDVINNWRLHLWVTEDELNMWDAQRSVTGTPWAVASRRLATQGSLTGRIQYELWPYQLSNANYPYFYVRRPEALSDSSTFLGPLATNGNILVDRALAEAAMWPGLEGKQNPYFNLNLAKFKLSEYETQASRLEVLDEDIYMTWLQTTKIFGRPFAPIDSNYLSSHDANMLGMSMYGTVF